MNQLIIIVAIMATLAQIGCAKRTNQPFVAPDPTKNIPPPQADNNEGLAPNSPNITYASGWSEIDITANMAKTKVTVGAHFGTSRNACGKDAYGAIELATWNSLAKNANLAIQNEPRALDYCVPIPDDNIYLNRGGLSVEVKTPTGNRALYDIKNGEICSTVQDDATSQALLDAINQVIEAADKEDCPNGWGSP